MFQIVTSIPLRYKFYIFDIKCSRGGHVYLSVSNTSGRLVKTDKIFFTSPSGGYIALEEDKFGEKNINYIYVSGDSVIKQHSTLREVTDPTPLFERRHLQRLEKKRVLLKQESIWNYDGIKSQTASQPMLKYTLQGIAIRKLGGVLICLWNNELNEKSLGKVISTKGNFEIFLDKNRPLYVCPTYTI